MKNLFTSLFIFSETALKKKVLHNLKNKYDISLDINAIRIKGKNIKIILEDSTKSACSQPTAKEIEDFLNPLFSKYSIHIIINKRQSSPPKSSTAQQKPIIGKHGNLQKIDRGNIKRIIAVASGKGGVGKSTISLNLARAFRQSGLKTALIDADIYGPSIPLMTGGYHQAKFEDKKLIPIEKEGIKLMSIGYMINPAKPVIWRGPMLSGALGQMFEQVAWGDIDVMVIDMPPGTGDIQLTLCQSVVPDGAVIVSTPQMTSVIDAERCANMFTQLNIEILGVIENMCGFTPPDTDKTYYIFGKGGAEAFAKNYKYPFLGRLPIEMDIPYLSDQGTDLNKLQIKTVMADCAEQLQKKYH